MESSRGARQGDGAVQCEEALLAEVRLLHEQLFGGPPPPEVARRYVAANRTVLPGLDPAQAASLERAVRLRCDAEAIECALRLRGKAHPLTTKLQILFYLVEVRSAYYARFVGESTARWRAAAALVAAAALTAWKLCKGSYLIARYRLV